MLKHDAAGIPYYAYGGDFGEKYFDNFTIKGVVAADGRPKAAMYECKRIFQPVQCEWADAEKGLIKVINRSPVKNVQDYLATLVIREDGIIIRTQTLPGIDVPPGEEQVIDISAYLPPMKNASEYHADLRFSLQQNKPWAGKGFEIASNQFLVKRAIVQHTAKRSGAAITVTENEKDIEVKGKDFAIRINRVGEGGLASYLYKGKEQIASPFIPHFIRPLTDNDKRGWKPHRKLRPWYEHTPKPTGATVSRSPEGHVIVTANFSMINDSAGIQLVYTINDKGVIKMDYTLNVKPGLPHLPKVGLQGGIAGNYRHLEWFGRGPLENYIDRRYGFDVGVYNMNIEDFAEPYVVPQENGNRTDVRWMYCSDLKKKEGLLIVADSLLSMSAWPYTEANIRSAKHTNDLKNADYITLNIDLVQMGVGGNDSWSDVAAPLEQYQVKAQPWHYSFYITPFNSKNTKAAKAAKEIRN